MRLINTRTLKLEEFSDDNIPKYAILSHTWGNDSEELTFRQVENGEIDKPGIGSTKFRGCCLEAKNNGIRYAWIDTCCIDKTNLVELSEAINSMFRWYSGASVCYAYLSDVPDGDDPLKSGSKFQTSRWFQRGWTLQELLAPKNLRFYNVEWRYIGTKRSIRAVIKNITHVPVQFLLGIAELHAASVAQRMSWAAQRKTKRAEDLAYCLLGIFGITMPMIYGEGGDQAFFRLQEQIMKTTRDDSILAWGLNNDPNELSMSTGARIMGGEILASGPSYFANSGQIIARGYTPNPLHSLDLFGGSLRLYLPLITTTSGETFGLLSCGPESSPQQVVGIPLAKATSMASDEYVRLRGRPSELQPVAVSEAPPELIHIKKDGQKDTSIKPNQQYWLYEEDLFAQVNLALVDVEPRSCWDEESSLISPINPEDVATNRIWLRFRHSEEGYRDFVMILEEKEPGSNPDPQFSIMICSRNTPLLALAEKHQDISSRASGETSASNGALHLRITLEHVEGGLTSINPEAMALPPDVTIDASVELERLDLILEFTQLLKEREQEKVKEEELNATLKMHRHRLQQAKEELEAVESQIEELEVKRTMLVKEEDDSAREMHHLKEERAKVEEKRNDIHTRWLHTQERLDKLQHVDGSEDGRSLLLREALKNGDGEVMRLPFTEEAVRIAARIAHGAVSLIEASSGGDVDLVKMLLTIDTVELECKDSRVGRTALSWASGNGHEAVVQLLLATGKVDVNSRDNNGRRPLHWAIEGRHKDIARLLLDKGAKIDCQQTLQGHSGIISKIAISRDSKLIASGSNDNTIKIWDSTTGQCLETLRDVDSDLLAVAFSHDSKLVASTSKKCHIEIWNRATGQCQTMRGHAYCVQSVVFSHDSKFIVSGSNDNTIKIWDSATGQCLQTLQGHENSVYTVVLSQDSKLIVSGSLDTTIKIWSSLTGKCQQTLRGHDQGILTVALSHDSKFIVSGSTDKTVRIWDSATGECLQTLRGHDGTVYTVAFSQFSTRIASGSWSTIIIYDTNNRQIKLQDLGINGNLRAFSHDLMLMVTASARGKTIKLWDSSVLSSIGFPFVRLSNGDWRELNYAESSEKGVEQKPKTPRSKKIFVGFAEDDDD